MEPKRTYARLNGMNNEILHYEDDKMTIRQLWLESYI